MSTSDSCTDSTSKSNNDEVCDKVNDMLQNMSTADISICANCGKEGNDVNNICNKCKMVKYCNAACKKKHRHKHKKQCERQVAELHDEKLFKQPPPKEDCPICFLRLPYLNIGSRYMSCCGKVICSGCMYAPVYDNQGNKVNNKKCPFCRTPDPTTQEETNEREKKRLKVGDGQAFLNIGYKYFNGRFGYPQDRTKALDLFHRAAELGHGSAYNNIGNAYEFGVGVEIDKKKAIHYYEHAAMGGNVAARHSLGNDELRAGHYERAIKHYMIAVTVGYDDSLKIIQKMYKHGDASREVYTKALQSYQTYLGEIKSRQRDEAAAADDEYRYY